MPANHRVTWKISPYPPLLTEAASRSSSGVCHITALANHCAHDVSQLQCILDSISPQPRDGSPHPLPCSSLNCKLLRSTLSTTRPRLHRTISISLTSLLCCPLFVSPHTCFRLLPCLLSLSFTDDDYRPSLSQMIAIVHFLSQKLLETAKESLHIGAFKPKMCQFVSANKRRIEEFTNLIKRIAARNESHINFTEGVLSSIYSIISKAAFGAKNKDQEEFISVAKEAATIVGGLEIGYSFPSCKLLQLVSGLGPRLESLHRQIDQILENIINDHKEAKSKAKAEQGELDEVLVDVLLKFEDGNGTNMDICLTKSIIKAIILDIFGVGGEAVATTID